MAISLMLLFMSNDCADSFRSKIRMKNLTSDMFEFCRGWKRKAGILASGFACLFLMGWVRSFQELDYIQLVGPEADYYLRSDEFGLSSSRHQDLRSDQIRVWEHFPQFQIRSSFLVRKLPRIRYVTYNYHNYGPLTEVPPGYRWHGIGFHYGQGPSLNADGQFKRGYRWHVTKVVVPYWSVVIPLTILSTYLLLSKRREKQM